MLNTLLYYVVPDTVKISSICINIYVKIYMIKYHLFIIKALRPRTALPALFVGLER